MRGKKDTHDPLHNLIQKKNRDGSAKLRSSYEFPAVPRSMFSSDGQLLLGSDKATIMHQVETLLKSSTENDQQIEGADKVNTEHVILFDDIQVVNRLKLGASIINCQQFAEAFFRIIQEKLSHVEEVRVIFVQYSTHVQYKVQNDTSLKNLTLKKFLSHIQIKQDLTVYLGKYLVKEFTEEQITFAVSFNTATVTTISSIDSQLLENNHQKPDTVLIFHALDVAKQNPFRQLKVASPDTDVLLLLIHYCPDLPVLTGFVTGRGKACS